MDGPRSHRPGPPTSRSTSEWPLSKVLEDGHEVVWDDSRRKASLLFLVSAVLVPPLIGFALEDLLAGRWGEGLAEAVAIAVLLAALVLLRLGVSVALASRSAVVTGLAVLTYELISGGGDGHAVLWFFVFPLATFFLLGQREGSVVVATSALLLAVFALAWPASRIYYHGTGLRLVITYTAVSLLAWGLESSRRRYDLELRREHAELQAAVAHIRMLTGLLPVCAWCKKVRDDEGYWSALDSYLERFADVRFTHGICPECRERVTRELPDPTS